MGMFDSLYAQCPKCSHLVEFQSKEGDCELANFVIADAPVDILLDVLNRPRCCRSCGQWVALVDVNATSTSDTPPPRPDVAAVRVREPEDPIVQRKGDDRWWPLGRPFTFDDLEETLLTVRRRVGHPPRIVSDKTIIAECDRLLSDAGIPNEASGQSLADRLKILIENLKSASSAAAPIGWKLVPKNLTPEMRVASKLAVRVYLDSIPDSERAKMPVKSTGETKVSTNLKHEVRYQAAIAHAPAPPAGQPKEGA
jgi:hypothetical protein